MPLGIAHEASVPSCSRRRSQCRRVAWCSWTTKRPAAAGSPSPAAPVGSLVVAKSRFARYSARRSFATTALTVLVGFLVGLAVGLGAVLLLGEVLLTDAHLDLGLGRALLGVLAELLLGHLEALRLAAAGLVDRIHGGVVRHVLLQVARRPAADVARLGGGRLGLFLGEAVVFVGHRSEPDIPSVHPPTPRGAPVGGARSTEAHLPGSRPNPRASTRCSTTARPAGSGASSTHSSTRWALAPWVRPTQIAGIPRPSAAFASVEEAFSVAGSRPAS